MLPIDGLGADLHHDPGVVSSVRKPVVAALSPVM